MTGIDRPFQAGDQVTQYRHDFFRHYSQVVLIEEIIPSRALHLRDLSKSGSRLNATAIISLEPAQSQDATWVEEAVFYSLGNGRGVQWLDHWLVNPLGLSVSVSQINCVRAALGSVIMPLSRKKRVDRKCRYLNQHGRTVLAVFYYLLLPIKRACSPSFKQPSHQAVSPLIHRCVSPAINQRRCAVSC